MDCPSLASIFSAPEVSGHLVTLRAGSYLKAPPFRGAPFVHVPEKTSALLLNFQGSNTESLWHALVEGDVLLVWGDSCLGPESRPRKGN